MDEPSLRSVVAQMKEDAEVTEDVPLDRIIDLRLLREVHAEGNPPR